MDIEKACDKDSKKGDVVGDEEERYTRSNSMSGNEPLSRGEDESWSGIRVI